MVPTLADGNIVLYVRTVPEYRQGDVVTIRVPDGAYYVKRVIAVGGDVVDIYEGAVYVNGEQIEDAHAYGITEEQSGGVIYPYVVREGNVFVLGDNREVSMDSRTFGEVSFRQIRGKIVFWVGSGGIGRVE